MIFQFYKKYIFLMLSFVVFCINLPSAELSPKIEYFSKEKQQLFESLTSFIQKNKALATLFKQKDKISNKEINILKSIIEEYVKNNHVDQFKLNQLFFKNTNLFEDFYSNDFINLPQDEKLRNSFLRLRFIILENSKTDHIFNYAAQYVNEPLYVDILKFFLDRYMSSIIDAKQSESKKLKNYIIQLGRKLLTFEKEKLHEKDILHEYVIISNQKILEMPPFLNIFNEARNKAINPTKPQASLAEKIVDEIINELKIEILKELT